MSHGDTADEHCNHSTVLAVFCEAICEKSKEEAQHDLSDDILHKEACVLENNRTEYS